MKKDSTAYGALRPEWDKRDCSVRALACAVGCGYEQASVVYSTAGRALKRGTPLDLSGKVLEQWLGMEPVDVAGLNLAGFAVMYPKGEIRGACSRARLGGGGGGCERLGE